MTARPSAKEPLHQVDQPQDARRVGWKQQGKRQKTVSQDGTLVAEGAEAGLAVRRISELLDSSSDRAKVLSRFIDGLSPREAKAIRAILDTTTPDTGER